MKSLQFNRLGAAILTIAVCSSCRANHAIQPPLERGLANKLQHWFVQPKLQEKDALFPLGTESELQTSLEQYVKKSKLPGAVVAIASTQKSWMGVTGEADIASHSGMQATDRFRIGNLSEMFIAVVCLQLEAEGALNLSDTLPDWLPAEIYRRIPDSREITVRQLLNHTSRLPDLDVVAFQQAVIANPAHRWTAKELLDFIPNRQPTTPRGVFSYSTFDYLLLQLIVERATGEPLAKAIEERIVAPLSLKDTFVELSSNQPLAHGYQDWNQDGSLEDVTKPLINTGLGLGGKAIVSNAPDLIHFFRALFLENTLLSASSQQEMLTLVETRKGSYGLGIMHLLTRWGEIWGQVGDTTGFSATLFYLPVHDLIIVTWTNSAGETKSSPIDLTEKSLSIVLGSVYRFSNSATVQW